MFWRGLKDNVKNKMMRDGQSVKNLKIIIEVVIDLNDKLYERAIEKRYSRQHLERKGYHVERRNQQVRFETSFRKTLHKILDDTIFMKLDAMLFKKSKSKGKKPTNKKKKKYDVLRMW